MYCTRSVRYGSILNFICLPERRDCKQAFDRFRFSLLLASLQSTRPETARRDPLIVQKYVLWTIGGMNESINQSVYYGGGGGRKEMAL